ncbi:hypothetical protein BD289DRAFT_434678 [Coniella lustricola]|uniref:Zn(2)-C6 fungal-type domain-containing protein n=1 Tax=Coniella lustricola TaxID=2025994 RepID=A0A2T3A784_9PEZI|nr:hypothetical protein BD289DRAFT_434678 [Coniella lustricola]
MPAGFGLILPVAMVYCGRPSANCSLCRAKKKRCDKATPGCGQCRRTGQACPGYYDPSSIIIRNETSRVIQRARAGKPSRPRPSLTPVAPPPRCSSSVSPPSTVLSTPESDNSSHNNSSWSRDLDCDNASETGSNRENGHGSLLLREDHPSLISLPSPHHTTSCLVPCPQSPITSLDGLDGLGINYFLANYVLSSSGPCPGFLNYTSDILANAQGDQELAQAAVSAAGLATLASTSKAPRMMRRARTAYNNAISRVNRALADPSRISSDTTLFAVLVLGLFESITCCGQESLDAWKNHINGAASLLVRRGTAQFATPMGLRLFGEAVAHVLTLCSRYGQPVPPRIRFLRVEMERRSGDGSSVSCTYRGPSWTLGTAHIEVMDLYHRVNPDAQETAFLQDEWETLLSQAAALERRLESLVADLPVSWRFKIVTDPEASPEIVHGGIYHIYYNSWVAKVWDGIRACRIILNQAIYCLLLREGLTWAPHMVYNDGHDVANNNNKNNNSTGSGAYAGMLQRISSTTTQMRDGILASVPQMLGFVDVHQSDGQQARLDTFKLSSHCTVPASGAYFVLWYLFLAGSLPINTAETRDWVVRRLRGIQTATGIQKAGYLADVLENHPAFISAVLPTDAFLVPYF